VGLHTGVPVAGERMRTLDRAMWQFSKERRPPTGIAATDPGHDRSTRGRRTATPTSTAPRGKAVHTDFPTDVYVLLVEAAIEGHTIFYSALPNGRRVGDRLRRIAEYERAHKRPPLTAIVVLKQTGRPGQGFGPEMAEIGYAKAGEPSDVLWKRALDDVFKYWRP
jgi:hypothetical protein